QTTAGKVNILLQACLSNANVENFALISDSAMLKLVAQVAPITCNILRWIFVEDSENIELYHSEFFILNRKQLEETQKISFLNHLVLPENYHQHTELLSLPPLPITALKNKSLEEICIKKFNHFNPVQTQVFDTFYNSSSNVLIGVPTGSGQTVTVELAMWWAFCEHPRSKIVYIAPLKALVRERIDDWQARLTGPMKEKRLVDLTGDVTPDLRSIENADIIITTPEKWDGISRSWQHKSYVQIVSLVIIDEIHLLSGDRGPILEDLADWLCIDEGGLFNFSHSVRPVSLDISIKGFSERHYCSRMATMNY
ncbi:14987_t:CDS:2, partial [Funneliformis geosporum]